MLFLFSFGGVLKRLGPPMMNVFAYGSLMFERIWSNVVTGLYEMSDATLCGYKRRKIKDEIYPALLPGTKEDFVFGKLYFNVAKKDIAKLDRFEGEYYQRKIEECMVSDGSSAAAFVYIINERYNYLIEDEDWDPDWFSKMGIDLFISSYRGFR